MSDARRYAVWPEPRSRSRSLKGSRPSVPHGTNFCLITLQGSVRQLSESFHAHHSAFIAAAVCQIWWMLLIIYINKTFGILFVDMVYTKGIWRKCNIFFILFLGEKQLLWHKNCTLVHYQHFTITKCLLHKNSPHGFASPRGTHSSFWLKICR